MPDKKKIGIICSRFPYPLDKGDKLRLFHQIKYLAQFFDIYLYAINEEKISEKEQEAVSVFCKKVYLYPLHFLQKAFGILKSIQSNEPVQVGYFYSEKIKQQMEKSFKKNKLDILYCQLSRTYYYGMLFKGPVIFDYQDCFSKNYERAAQNSRGLKKLFYQREHKSMLNFEKKINASFIRKTIICAFDKEQLPFPSEKIVVVPNGVDASFYHPLDRPQKYDLLFSGNLAYQPNEQAALFIIEELVPALQAIEPNIRICIAGKTANKTITEAQSANLKIVTKVEDMREMYGSAKVFIAPLFTGAGLQNKLLEAMSMGIPCIATTVTNLSLQAKEGQEIYLADNLATFTAQCLSLLKNETERNRLAQAGQKFIHQTYTWDQANQRLLKELNHFL